MVHRDLKHFCVFTRGALIFRYGLHGRISSILAYPFLLATCFAKMLQGLIDGHTVNPGLKRRLKSKLADFGEQGYKEILNHIVDMVLPNDTSHNTNYLCGDPLVNLLLRFLVAESSSANPLGQLGIEWTIGELVTRERVLIGCHCGTETSRKWKKSTGLRRQCESANCDHPISLDRKNVEEFNRAQAIQMQARYCQLRLASQ